MMRYFFLSIILSLITSASFAATDIMEVFREAVVNDATYQQTVADTLATQENIGISLASLLPNIGFTAKPSANKAQNSGSVTPNLLPPNNLLRNFEMRLSVNQTIFNYAKFANLATTASGARQACATLNAAFQSLILRVAQAYFNILKDEETLNYCHANQASLNKQYEFAKEKFIAKSITKADFYNVEAARASANTSCVTAKTQLEIDKEFLRTLTNKAYQSLASLNDDFPLVSPQPNDSEAWVHKSIQQNWTIKANQYALQSARNNIKQQFGGHLPTLDFEGYYDVLAQNSQNGSTLVSAGASKMRQTVVALNLSIPLFSGGATSSQVKQAKYQYQSAAQQLEYSVRTTIYNIRQTYLTLISNISKINDDKIAMKSAMLSLSATNERYQSGIGTTVDVLNQRQVVVQNQQQYTSDRYGYIMNLLTLKNAAGTLCVDDLRALNNWLRK
ncbi:MAG: TolC family outer membrane protein [Gammaproteobacteria bacterium]